MTDWDSLNSPEDDQPCLAVEVLHPFVSIKTSRSLNSESQIWSLQPASLDASKSRLENSEKALHDHSYGKAKQIDTLRWGTDSERRSALSQRFEIESWSRLATEVTIGALKARRTWTDTEFVKFADPVPRCLSGRSFVLHRRAMLRRREHICWPTR